MEKKWSEKLKTCFGEKDRIGEAKCLEKLGHVYLERGRENHDGMDYVKATALYNASLARRVKCTPRNGSPTKNYNQSRDAVNKLKLHIIEAEKKYIQQEMINKSHKLDMTKYSYKVCQERKSKIELLRKNSRKRLEDLMKKYPAYEKQFETPEEKNLIEKQRSVAVQLLFKSISDEMKSIVKELFIECLQIGGQPPCEYSLISMGSLATDTITPYSDLELAILLEEGKDSEKNKSFFRKIIYLLWIRVVNYGETILPTMQIKSLAKSDDEYVSWFEDYVTPRGFSFDGQVPWASKTPLGRKATENKPPVELIRSPKSMASLHFEQVTTGIVGYNLNYALLNVALVAGSEQLVNEYRKQTRVVLDSPLPSNIIPEILLIVSFLSDLNSVRAVLSVSRLINILKDFKPGNPFEGKLEFNLKKEIYRLPIMIATFLSLHFNISENNPWKIFDKLKNMGLIENNNEIHLKIISSIANELRLKAYQSYSRQKDKTTGLQQIKQNMENESDDLYRQDNVTQLARYYATIIPFQEYATNLVKEITSPSRSLPLFQNIKLHTNEKIIKAQFSLNFAKYENAIKILKEQNLIDLPCFKNDDVFSQIGFLSMMGSAFTGTGNYEKAIKYNEQACLSYAEIYGENSLMDACSVSCLSLNFISSGEFEKAHSCLRQALQKAKELYGENCDHRDIATSLNNFGLYYCKLGEYKEALEYHKKAYMMRRRIHAEKGTHPRAEIHISDSLLNLGSTYEGLENFKAAILYYEEAYKMKKDIYGGKSAHPQIAICLNNLAATHNLLGNSKKSLDYNTKALQMLKEIHGENADHPDTACTLNNLAISYFNLDKFETSKKYQEQAYHMRKKIYGENTSHPHIATSMNNLANVYCALENYKDSIEYGKQAFEMQKEVYFQNRNHPHIAETLYNLAFNYYKMGNYKKSIEYGEKSLKVIKQIFGQNTPHLLKTGCLGLLAQSYEGLGNCTEAKRYTKEMNLAFKYITAANIF